MKADRLFEAISGSDLRYYGVRLNIHPMEYPFYLADIFGDDSRKESDLESFIKYISELVFLYITKWKAEYNEDSAETLRAAYEFKCQIDFKKVFEAVYTDSDHKAQQILIPISNAQLCMKRYGNGLALRLVANNSSSQEVHTNGTKIFEALSNETSGWGAYLREFIHSVESIIALPKKRGTENSVTVDFGDLHHNLTEACPYIQWHSTSDFVCAISNAYTKPSDYNPGVAVGKSQKSGLDIIAELIHFNSQDTNKLPIWRRGNINNLGDFTYNFFSGDDVCLSLKVKCPFRSSSLFEEVDLQCRIREIQNDLLITGATLCSQLRSMMANVYSF